MMVIKAKQPVIKNPIFLYLGVLGIIGGSLTLYFFAYKHTQEITFSFVIPIMLGWFGVFHSVFPDVFNRDKRGVVDWLPQSRFFKIVIILLLAFLIGTNINYVTRLERSRESYILTNEPTITTTALLIEVEVRQLKNGVRHYAHFSYTMNGETVYRETPDDELQFIVGHYYKLKYSVRFPGMFILYAK